MEETKQKFKVGDKVVCLTDNYHLEEYGNQGPRNGDILEVVNVCFSEGYWIDSKSVDVAAINQRSAQSNFKLLKETSISIARPILEERKIGKVQMELFDEGFPNAVMEVAKVMTWAAENKGYKPHDWKNLPNAAEAFPAAASRHRVKGLIQKVAGVSAESRVDEESAILHKAHEAFNVLAELELMLTGKFV